MKTDVHNPISQMADPDDTGRRVVREAASANILSRVPIDSNNFYSSSLNYLASFVSFTAIRFPPFAR